MRWITVKNIGAWVGQLHALIRCEDKHVGFNGVGSRYIDGTWKLVVALLMGQRSIIWSPNKNLGAISARFHRQTPSNKHPYWLSLKEEWLDWRCTKARYCTFGSRMESTAAGSYFPFSVSVCNQSYQMRSTLDYNIYSYDYYI